MVNVPVAVLPSVSVAVMVNVNVLFVPMSVGVPVIRPVGLRDKPAGRDDPGATAQVMGVALSAVSCWSYAAPSRALCSVESEVMDGADEVGGAGGEGGIVPGGVTGFDSLDGP